MYRKIENIIILIKCFFVYLTFGRANKVGREIKKIIIIQGSANLGDMVCVTPMFTTLKKKFPTSKVFIAGGKKGEDVLYGNKYVDSYIRLEGAHSSDLKKIKDVGADFGCVVNMSFNNLASLYLSRIPVISAFSLVNDIRNFQSRTYNILKKFVITMPFRIHHYVLTQYLSLLEPIGIKDPDVEMSLSFTKESDKKIKKELANKSFSDRDFIVSVAPGSASRMRWWPSERYSEFLIYLNKNYGAKFLFLGYGEDEEPTNEIIEKVGDRIDYLNFLGQNIDDLKSTISKSKLLLGSDSAPAIIAEALGTPTLMFAGPTDEREHHPPSAGKHRIVKSPTRGEPVTYMTNWFDYDENEAFRQMDEVTVDLAIKEFNILKKEANLV